MDEAGPFPLYHVLADVGEFAGGDVMKVTGDSLWQCALAVRKGRRLRVLVANLHWQPRPITLEVPAGYSPGHAAAGTAWSEELPPYAVKRLDYVAGS